MNKPITCHECGSVFNIEPELEVGEVSFCPYCSSELYTLDEEDDLLDDEDSGY